MIVTNETDFVPTAPSDQLTATVRVLMFVTEVSIVKVREKDTPPEVTVAVPATQLFDPLAGAAPASGSNSCVAGTATVTSGGVSFSRTLTIDTSVTNIKTLTVAVSWSEGAVGTKSVSLVTIMAAS